MTGINEILSAPPSHAHEFSPSSVKPGARVAVLHVGGLAPGMNTAARAAGEGVLVTAHEAADYDGHLPRSVASYAGERAEEAAAAVVSPPDRTFSSVTAIDLGDRVVELVHPGRGHTDGDARPSGRRRA